jgi:DNA-binding transcriptional MerR regulator
MDPNRKKADLPAIPAKRYFTIGEVSELCGVKPHVLRYWEQEFTQLKPVKRRGNRRYYQHHEVLLIRRIRELLYEEGFTISGARNRLDDVYSQGREAARAEAAERAETTAKSNGNGRGKIDLVFLRRELQEVIDTLAGDAPGESDESGNGAALH